MVGLWLSQNGMCNFELTGGCHYFVDMDICRIVFAVGLLATVGPLDLPSKCTTTALDFATILLPLGVG